MPGLEPGIHAGTPPQHGTAGEGFLFCAATHFTAVQA
jgi:hypothetical protein